MQKLIFLVDDLVTAQSVVDTLNTQGVQEGSINVIANDRTPLGDLPVADQTEETDVVPAFKRGIAMGSATGLLLGMAAMAFPPAGMVIGGGAVLAGITGGASFGAFASALIGTSVPNSEIENYEQAIESGKLLMVVELEEATQAAVKQAIAKQHPEVKIQEPAELFDPQA